MLIRYTDKIYTQYRNVLKDLPAANNALSYCFINPVIFQALLDERVVLKNATLRQEASPSNEGVPTTRYPSTAQFVLACPRTHAPTDSDVSLC